VEREGLLKGEMVELTDLDVGIDYVNVAHSLRLVAGFGQ